MPKAKPKITPVVQRNIYVFDSGTHEVLPEHRIYAVSYEPFWQTVRMKLAFRTVDDTVASLARMDAYIALEDPGHAHQCALWRCYNLALAIPHNQINMRTGIHYIEASASAIIDAYLGRIIDRIREAGQPEYWDWNDTRKPLTQMCVAGSQHEIQQIWQSLTDSRARKKDAKTELRYFLDMISDTLDRYEDYGGKNDNTTQ